MSPLYKVLPTLIVICAVLMASPSSQADWKSLLGKAHEAVTGEPQTGVTATAISALSNSDMVDGLKQALIQGSRAAVDTLGQEGGFLDNPQVRIPLPEKLQSLETGLRAIGQGAVADSFITSMNQAAEQAVPQATDLFVNTISNMSLEDAQAVLKGPDDAATQYLREHSGAQLYDLMKPMVNDATDKVGVTSAYKNMFSKAGFLGKTIDADAIDLDNYVTEQAMNGLFELIAAEEQRIREDPVARTTDLLKKVFSAVN
ncbi:MAG: DUF4197 domain-containing protein [Gammaproteobacteria bacterium]|nr:DUF4197 domain-containing protein [Gammaproteobacteria bacterium]MBQ0838355.1 DUF4197 domain-containing protein [Gammaproteobacteria bacterium]